MSPIARLALDEHRRLIAEQNAALAAYKANPTPETYEALRQAQETRRAVSAHRMTLAGR